MASEAQVAANSANALHSTGPKTAAGKAASANNHLSHGLAGSTFTVLAWEDPNAFTDLSARLELEHKPETITEEILIRKSSSLSICATRPRTTAPFRRACPNF